MDDPAHPRCGLCRAQVPRDLMHFHALWHESQAGRSTRFFCEPDVDPEVARILQVVAALRALPPVTARPEFVRELRERLVDEARTRVSRPLSLVTGTP